MSRAKLFALDFLSQAMFKKNNINNNKKNNKQQIKSKFAVLQLAQS